MNVVEKVFLFVSISSLLVFLAMSGFIMYIYLEEKDRIETILDSYKPYNTDVYDYEEEGDGWKKMRQ